MTDISQNYTWNKEEAEKRGFISYLPHVHGHIHYQPVYMTEGRIHEWIEHVNTFCGNVWTYPIELKSFSCDVNEETLGILLKLGYKLGLTSYLTETPTNTATRFSCVIHKQYKDQMSWSKSPIWGSSFEHLTLDQAIARLSLIPQLTDFTTTIVIKQKAKNAKEASELVRTALKDFDFELEIK